MYLLANFRYRFLLFLFLLPGVEATGQKAAGTTDKIFTRKNAVIHGTVKEITRYEIHYIPVSDTKNERLRLPKADVWKIVWNNGDEEVINEPVAVIPVVSDTVPKVTDLLVTRTVPLKLKFWDKSGFFFDLKLSGGVGVPAGSGSAELLSSVFPVGAIGAGGGFNTGSLAFRLDANYAIQSFMLGVPESSAQQGVEGIKGIQQNLMVPLTATLLFRLGTVKAGVTLGGFGTMQVGSGIIEIQHTELKTVRYKHCSDCKTKGLAAGATAGLSATLVEKAGLALLVDALWYHTLKDNREFRRAETGLNAHQGLIGVSLLRRFSD